MDGRWLLLETSEAAHAGLLLNGRILESVLLPKGREHNRALVPAVRGLLERHGLKRAELSGFAVGTGPGSYTGLRIGLMLAKTLAYATGRPLVAVPTFHLLAAAVAGDGEIDVIADALKRTVYVQRFGPSDGEGVRPPLDGLRAEKLDDWMGTLREGQAVTGPGLELHGGSLPPHIRRATVEPGAALAALAKSMAFFPILSREELFSLEPLYVRGSSAEEKAKEMASAAGPTSA